ncbi:MAG TPA: AAA family ATPase, partial [Pseudomonadales bacterium]|nr:AAA family ATPase [Pseudomonadales bacterium]
VLLTPAFDSWANNQWAETPDPDYERLASYPHASETLTQHFIRHVLASLTSLTRTADTVLLQEAEHPGTLMAQSWPTVTAVLDDGESSPEQQLCLQQLAQHTGVSVLLAGRGHGKSALLGFAARQWLAQGKRVLLVAPSRATAVSVFRHVGSRNQNSELAFSAPDMLLQDKSITADVLLIDEAAAIPLPMLLALLQRFPHAVLATTTDGYEGTGQGFVLRFLRELDQQCPGWQKLALA